MNYSVLLFIVGIALVILGGVEKYRIETAVSDENQGVDYVTFLDRISSSRFKKKHARAKTLLFVGSAIAIMGHLASILDGTAPN